MNVIKIRVESFEAYGLNKYRNFIDERTQIPYYENPADIIELCLDINEGCECNNCAIFLHFNNDMMVAIVNDEIYYNSDGYLDFFAEVDSEFRLCCYALIMETSPGNWKVIAN